MLKIRAPREREYFPQFVLERLRQDFEKSRGDGKFAAHAWLFCRRAGITPPRWVLDTADLSARLGVLAPKANGSGYRSKFVKDARRASAQKVAALLNTAWDMYWSDPRFSRNYSLDWFWVREKTLAALAKEWARELAADVPGSNGATRKKVGKGNLQKSRAGRASRSVGERGRNGRS